MPPRLPSICNPLRSYPTILTNVRCASILASISDTKGAYNKPKRVGRGPSSGKGKTSGRGHKGQKQHGKVPAGFGGGQTPDHIVKGERGFTNKFALQLAKINLDRVQSWIDAGRLDPAKPITLKELHSSRCTHGIKDGVKLLARNAQELRTPIDITVSRASQTAIAAVEALGGKVTTRYYTRPSIRRIISGETHPTLSLLSLPPPHLRPASTSGTDDADPLLASPLSSTAPAETDTPLSNTTPAEISPPPTTYNIPPKPKSLNSDNNPFLAEILKYKYRLPDPASRTDLEYYRDPSHRGYLSYQMTKRSSPSLFFKPLKRKFRPRKVEGAQPGAKKASRPTDLKMW